MILPLYANLVKHRPRRCSRPPPTWAASPWQAFSRSRCRCRMPGIIAGCLLVFIPAVGEFVIPALLGGPDTLMIGQMLWTEFFNNRDWPVASAVAIVLLVLLVIPIMLFQRCAGRGNGRRRCTDEQRRSWFRLLALVLGFAFLYIPIFVADRLLVQRLAAGHGVGRASRPSGTASCCSNQQILGAAWLSLQIAAVSRDASRWCSGTLAALVLARFGPLPGQDAVHRHDHRAAGHARSHHRALAAAAVRDHGAADRLARRPRHHDHRDRPRHLLHGLCHGRRAVPPLAAGPLAGGGGDGPGRAPVSACSS